MRYRDKVGFWIYLVTIGMSLLFRGGSAGLLAQEEIRINDSLLRNGEVLNVLIQKLPGRTTSISLGEYTVMMDERAYAMFSASGSSFAGVKSKSKVTEIRSFYIVSPSNDTAVVTTEERSVLRSYYPNGVFPDFPIGITKEKTESFTVWIMMPGSTAPTWMLSIQSAPSGQGGLPVYMMLTDGVTVIEPVLVTSDPDFDADHPFRSLMKMPAIGVEFYEHGQSVCAMQYFGGKSFRPEKQGGQSFGCKGWMLRHPDAHKELMLAAAMSTFLVKQMASSSQGE